MPPTEASAKLLIEPGSANCPIGSDYPQALYGGSVPGILCPACDSESV